MVARLIKEEGLHISSDVMIIFQFSEIGSRQKYAQGFFLELVFSHLQALMIGDDSEKLKDIPLYSEELRRHEGGIIQIE